MMRLIAKIKFRFDLGSSFLTMGTFAMACISAAPNISAVCGVSAKVVVLIAIPGSIVSVILFGTVLDRLKFWHFYTDHTNERNRLFQELKHLK